MTPLPATRSRRVPLLAGATAASLALAFAWASHSAHESSVSAAMSRSTPSRIVVAGAEVASDHGRVRATYPVAPGRRTNGLVSMSPSAHELIAMFDRAAGATVPPSVTDVFSRPTEALGALCLPSLKNPLRFFCQYTSRELTLGELEALAIAGNASAAAFWFDSQSYETDPALRETARQIMVRRAGMGDPAMYANLASWYRGSPELNDEDRGMALALAYAAWLSELWGGEPFESPELAKLSPGACQQAMALGVTFAARHGWDMKERAREAVNGVRSDRCR